MPNLVAIPLKTNVSIVEVSSSGLIEICQIHFKEQVKVVVCENETIVSLVKLGTETFVYAHKIIASTPVKIWEKKFADEVCYSHIVVKGNVAFLGTFYLANTQVDPLLCIDFSGSKIEILPVVHFKQLSGKNILNMKVYGNSLYLFENNYPMRVVECDVSNPLEPKVARMSELEISARLQFVKNFALTSKCMAVVSNYNDNLNLTNYLHLYGRVGVTFKSYFSNIYQNDTKYINLRNEMGFLPESVQLKGRLSWLYHLRTLGFNFFAVIQSLFEAKRHFSMFNLMRLRFPTGRIVPVKDPVRIVDVLFSDDRYLFMIANGRVCVLDIDLLDNPFFYFVDNAVDNPVSLIYTGIPNSVIVRSNAEYAFVSVWRDAVDQTLCSVALKIKECDLMLKNRL